MLFNIAIFTTGVVVGVFLSPPAQASVKWAVNKAKGWFQK